LKNFKLLHAATTHVAKNTIFTLKNLGRATTHITNKTVENVTCTNLKINLVRNNQNCIGRLTPHLETAKRLQ